MMLILPTINGSSQAIWQAKVMPAVQGRVFAVRRTLAQASAPVAMLAAGPLADHVFEPWFNSSQTAPAWAARLVGTGPGAGMGFMLIISGVLSAAVGLSGYLARSIRDVENIIPDHDADSPPDQPGGEPDADVTSGSSAVGATGPWSE
jgi:hypothetical protein